MLLAEVTTLLYDAHKPLFYFLCNYVQFKIFVVSKSPKFDVHFTYISKNEKKDKKNVELEAGLRSKVVCTTRLIDDPTDITTKDIF